VLPHGDARARDGRGATPLMWAADRARAARNPGEGGGRGRDPGARAGGGAAAVEALLAASAPGAVDDAGRGALAYAARRGHADVVCRLLRRAPPPDAAEVDARDEAGRCALAAAADGGHAAVVDALLGAGADAAAADDGGRAPLHWAAGRGHGAVVDALLAAPGAAAAAAARDATGRTPADLARDAGHGDVAVRVESLLAPDPAP